MSSNNFKELEKLNIEGRKSNGEEIKSNLNSNIKLFSFISNIVELYLPKAGNVLTTMISGKDEIKSSESKK